MSSNKSSIRSDILCDDILIMILCELNVRQLLRLERVSQQFMDCVGSALQRKNGLSVGNIPKDMKCMDKKHALTNGQLIGGNNSEEIVLNSTFRKILKMCPNIKSLYLEKCWTENWFKGINITLIADNCPRLECLAVNRVKYCGQMCDDLEKLQLNHLTINSFENRMTIDNNLVIDFEHLFTIGLPSLQRLSLYKYNQSLSDLFIYLPQTIRALDLIECHSLTIDAMNVLFSGYGLQLNRIDIKYIRLIYNKDINPIFTAICNVLTLDRLSYHCSQLSIEALKTIEKQTQLKRLSLKTTSIPILLNAVNWHLLPQLQRLALPHICIDESTNDVYFQLLPMSVKRLSFTRISHKCLCFEWPGNAPLCNPRFATWLPYVPQLTQLGVHHMEYWFDKRFVNFEMNFADFHVFNAFKCFTIKIIKNPYNSVNELVVNIADNLVKTRCMTNRFTIYLNKKIYDVLNHYLSIRNFSVPINYILAVNPVQKVYPFPFPFNYNNLTK